MTKRIVSLICLTAACLLLVSCFPLSEPEPPTPAELSRIAAQKRFEQLKQRGLLRVAVSTSGGDFAYLTQNGTFDGPEVKAVRAAADRNKWKIFLFAVRPESLAAAVRNGRADLAIGGLKPDEIRAALLTPVREYRQNGEVYAFAAWNDAEELKKLLEP